MRRQITTMLAALVLGGCDTETATTAIVDNAYPAVPNGGDPTKETTVFKGWYVSTVFLDAVAPGASSAEQRTVPSSDYAYVLLAPGWDPGSPTPPTTLVALRSKAPISVARGDTLHLVVSDATFDGNCAAGSSLSQADADFITQSIFPGDFATVTYDAKTCASTPIPTDGGAPDAGDAASDAGDGGPG